METVIKENLVKFWEDKDIFCKEQHGFTRGRSSLANLLEMLENWTRTLDEGFGLDVVYLDYASNGALGITLSFVTMSQHCKYFQMSIVR